MAPGKVKLIKKIDKLLYTLRYWEWVFLQWLGVQSVFRLPLLSTPSVTPCKMSSYPAFSYQGESKLLYYATLQERRQVSSLFICPRYQHHSNTLANITTCYKYKVDIQVKFTKILQGRSPLRSRAFLSMGPRQACSLSTRSHKRTA